MSRFSCYGLNSREFDFKGAVALLKKSKKIHKEADFFLDKNEKYATI